MTTLALKRNPNPLTSLAAAKEYLAHELWGQNQLLEFSLTCLLSGGHLLLEGPPGTGKTSLAQALSSCFNGKFRRIQMTSDLLPSDVVGVMRPTSVQGDFVFREGPIFTNFLLADELNRTSPKTQAALLEAMAEATVTVDGETHALPNPFFVVATQNPFEFHGVYPLPESQLDRFMMQLVVSHPLESEELAIYRRDVGRAKMASELTLEDLAGLRSKVNQIFIEETVLEYCHKLVTATRSHARVKYGVSVRGALKFIRAAKSLAMIRGRDFVKPSDLQELAPFVLAHRLCMQDNGLTAQERQIVVQEILESTSSPK